MPRLRTANLLCALIFAGAAVLGTSAATAHAAPAAKLVGGAKVDRPTFDARWRSVVTVSSSGLFGFGGGAFSSFTGQCIGVLVAPDLVLTRAECAEGSRGIPAADRLQVVGGTRRIGSTVRYGDLVKVTEVIRNPRASTLPGGAAHLPLPYALVRLARPIKGGIPARVAGAQDAALWGNGAGRATGVFAASWSSDESESGSSSGARTSIGGRNRITELQSAELPVLSNSTCRTGGRFVGEIALRYDPETQLCVGRTKPKLATACSADEGAPLMANAADGAPVLIGLVGESSSEDRYGPSRCTAAAVARRIDALAPWMGAVRAELDAGRAGPAPVTNLAAELTSRDGFRLTWDPAAPGVVQQTVVRPLTFVEEYPMYLRYFGERIARLLAMQSSSIERVGLLGPEARSVSGAGIHPVTADPRRRASFQVITEDGLGRTSASAVVRLQPRIDSKAPTRPTALRARLNRYGVPSITWAASRDDDCVQAFELEYRRFGGRRWATQDSRETSDATCRPGTVAKPDPDDEYGAFDIGMFEMTRGRYHVRVVAYDRAGNRSVSVPIAVRVPKFAEDLDLEDECDLRGEQVVCTYPKDDFSYYGS